MSIVLLDYLLLVNMPLSEVFPNLFISNLEDITRPSLIQNGLRINLLQAHFEGITRILSVGAQLSIDLPDCITHSKHVAIQDTPEEDLLLILPTCLEYITNGCADEHAKVLVHW